MNQEHETEGDYEPMPSMEKTGAIHIGTVAMALGDLKRTWRTQDPKARIRKVRSAWQMLRELERLMAEEMAK